MKEFDVLIIGAGISGACIARELSKTNAKICIVDRQNDVACGASKANSGIVHAGYDPKPGTLMARLNVRGAELYPQLAKKLNFEYRNIGSLVVAFDDDGMKTVQELYVRGIENGVKDMMILSRADLCQVEPKIGPEAKGALYAKTAAVVNPYQATWAFAESAVINGATFIRNACVHGIQKSADGRFEVNCGGETICARYVVNAAGTGAAEISRMVQARSFTIKQRRGEYLLFDNEIGDYARHVIFQTPTALGKGILVTQTVDGNLLVGPSANDQDGKMLDYTGTTREALSDVYEKASLSIPDIPKAMMINAFSGIRAIAVKENGEGFNDFIIEEDESVKGFVNVAGICSPGLSSAPAIGEHVREILGKAGLDVTARDNFIEERTGIPNFKAATPEEKNELIKKDHRYGQIICRCETITEGEIVAAITSPLGARDLDGVKRRTRAGMGRCQGGFCMPRVTELISRETNIPMTSVTKFGGTSFVLTSEK